MRLSQAYIRFWRHCSNDGNNTVNIPIALGTRRMDESHEDLAAEKILNC